MKAKELISLLQGIDPNTEIYFLPSNSSYPEGFRDSIKENVEIRTFFRTDTEGAILRSSGQVGAVQKPIIFREVMSKFLAVVKFIADHFIRIAITIFLVWLSIHHGAIGLLYSIPIWAMWENIICPEDEQDNEQE